MAKASNSKQESNPVNRRFGSDQDVAQLTGLSRRTLQQDRLRGTDRFPFYRCGGRILYDLEEVEAAIRANRVRSNRGRF